MFSSRVGLAIVGAACVMAAGAGAFIATRYSGASAPPAAASAPAPDSAAGAATPVQETEAVVDEPKGTDQVAPVGASTDGAVAEAKRPAEKAAATPASARPSPKAAAAHPEPSPAPVRQARVERAPRTPEPARQPAPEPPVERRSAPPVAADSRAPAPMIEPVDQAPPADTTARREPMDTPREPERRLEELVVPGDSVIGLQLETSVSSETARVEDRVDARVSRDVLVQGRVAVPAGSRVRGAVTLVERGGKMRDRARLGVRFHTLVLADGTTMPIQTETVFREGDSPAASSSTKIGGAAIGGAVLGAILGGGRGAMIGGATGAAGGTAAVMAGGRRPATLTAGSPMTVRVLSPVTVTVEK